MRGCGVGRMPWVVSARGEPVVPRLRGRGGMGMRFLSVMVVMTQAVDEGGCAGQVGGEADEVGDDAYCLPGHDCGLLRRRKSLASLWLRIWAMRHLVGKGRSSKAGHLRWGKSQAWLPQRSGLRPCLAVSVSSSSAA